MLFDLNNPNEYTLKIIEVLSVFKKLKREQLAKVFADEKLAYRAIKALVSRKRIYESENKKEIAYSYEDLENPNKALINSFWVLLDFISKADYYIASAYPVQITFFSKDTLYEIIYIQEGEEIIISQLFKTNDNTGAKRLIVIENKEQIEKIKLDNIICFCTLDYGNVEYYKIK